jgi:hypothetical protein
MTPRDVPGPIVIHSLFPWLAALEPLAPTAAQPLRGTPSERAGAPTGCRRAAVSV